jgi:uncharacterized protein (TIGR00730 family)
MPELRRICLYAGSRAGADPAFTRAADALARELARRGIGVVYGGARVGLMGTLADAALAEGGEVIGILPSALRDREVGHTGLTRLEIVGTMHERKARMAELADAFIALPGGIGTLEEVVEAVTWTMLGIHRKPVGLLDVGGYWAPLGQMLDGMAVAGFLPPEHRALMLSAEDPDELLERLAGWDPAHAGAWIGRDVPPA